MDHFTPQSEALALDRANREISTLYELCAAVIQSIDVAEFLQTLIERAGQILQVRSGSIIMLDPDGYLRIKAYFGFKEENARAYKLKPEEGRGGRIFATRKAAIFVTSQDKSKQWFHQITYQENIEHTIGAPMIGAAGEVLGVLFLNDKFTKEPFDERDLKILENFANLAAIAVEKQKQLEEINRQKERYRLLYEKLEASLAELNALNERLVDSNKLKDEVLSICAHDVRSPLTAIISYAELLLSSENLSDKQHRYLEHIHRSSEKINNLVQNLLVRARYLESNEPLRPESVAIGQMARESLQQIEDRLVSKQVSVELEDGWRRRIRADRFKLAQVFDNLLDNAIKFTPEGGKIRVSIKPVNDGETVEIVIANSGQGIPAESLPRLFLRYFQAPSGQQRSGYGLGLAICKQNVELHGGEISVVSIPGEWTTFRFTLPVGRPYLFVLSDDEAFIERANNSLEARWRKESIGSCKDCIESVRQELPTLLLVDRRTGGLELNGLLAQLRREYEPSRLVIKIAIDTHENFSEPAERLPREFTPEQLLSSVEDN